MGQGFTKRYFTVFTGGEVSSLDTIEHLAIVLEAGIECRSYTWRAFKTSKGKYYVSQVPLFDGAGDDWVGTLFEYPKEAAEYLLKMATKPQARKS